MKSKEEAVRGLAADNWLKREKHFKEVYGLSVHEYHVSGHYMDGFKEGFDAGFQRAVEMLREATPLSVTGEVAPPGATTYNTGVGWASWLEKQSSPPPH